MATSPQHSFMTVEEYLELDRNSLNARYEYIDGQVLMLAGGTINHSTISVNILSFLRNALRGSPCRALNSDARVLLTENRYVLPDVTVTCDDQDRGEVDIIRSPLVIIEVLSPGTEMTDRREKLEWYRELPTVQEYALVNTHRRAVEMYRRGKNTLWSFLTFKPESDVEFVSLGVRIPMSVIYEDVEF